MYSIYTEDYGGQLNALEWTYNVHLFICTGILYFYISGFQTSCKDDEYSLDF